MNKCETYEFNELPKSMPIEYDMFNYSGYKFGESVALFRVEDEKHHKKILWACVCSCGRYFITSSHSIKYNRRTNCASKEHENLIGKKFGRLVVANKTNDYISYRGYKYICYCDCGNPEPKYAYRRDLINNEIISCGCMAGGFSDITGQRFGLLTAIRPTDGRNASGARLWECRCDCGNIIYEAATPLKIIL